MWTFSIEPFVGPLPIRFGMTSDEVERILGPPQRVQDNLTCIAESRSMVSLGYSKTSKRLIEAVFSEQSRLVYGAHGLLEHPDVITFLR